MLYVHEVVRSYGLIKTCELLGVIPRSLIDVLMGYGRWVHIRKGWYAWPDLPMDIQRAARVGGRLGCVSALAHHLGEPSPPLLHVTVVRDARNLLCPDNAALPLDAAGMGVVIHRRGGRVARTVPFAERLSVPLTVALEQARRCTHLTPDEARRVMVVWDEQRAARGTAR